eukprot:5235054-Alexandrium_andersonii.AAC.1
MAIAPFLASLPAALRAWAVRRTAEALEIMNLVGCDGVGELMGGDSGCSALFLVLPGKMVVGRRGRDA